MHRGRALLCVSMLVGLQLPMMAVDGKPSTDSTGSSLSVATGLQIVSSLISIGIAVGPYVYRRVTTGSWWSEEFKEHQIVAFKQAEETGRMNLSIGIMDECWLNVERVKKEADEMPQGEDKEYMMQKLCNAQKNYAHLVDHHTYLLSSGAKIDCLESNDRV